MGIIYSVKSKEDSFLKHHTHLLTCLSAGFCGCLTSFSSWQLECTNQFLSRNYMNLLDLQILGIASFLTSFMIGTHFAPVVLQIDFLFKDKQWTESIAIRRVTNFLFFGFWIVASLLTRFISLSWFAKHTLLSLLFCTVGCTIRYYLSLYNPLFISKIQLPLFTLLVNVMGCVLMSICVALQSLEQSKSFSIVLTGMSDGLFGSLTTVSTFILELIVTVPSLEMKYLYYLLSIGLSMPIMIALQLALRIF